MFLLQVGAKANSMQQLNKSEAISQAFRAMSQIPQILIGCIRSEEQKDHIDILFANAGLGESAPLEAITEAHFNKIFSVNVKGLLFTVQKALPLFQGCGSIILNASTAGSKASTGFSVYGATKAAVRSFARSWAVELRHRKIRVNAISPGPIDTPGLSGFVCDMA